MKPANSTLQKRIGLYLLLTLLVVASPFVIMMVMIMITGSRESGMGYGVLPGLLFPQLVFGLIFIRKPFVPRVMWIVAGILLTYGLFWSGIKLGMITSGWDIYGYWDLVLTSLIASIVAWELVYQMSSRLMKPTV